MKIGAAFSQHILTENLSRGRKNRMYHKDNDPRPRSIIFPIILIICFVILFGRLFFLQIIKGDYYRSISDSNRIKTTIIHAPRGIIFDRNGKPLVYNTPGFRKTVNGKTLLLDNEDALSLLAKGDTHLEIDSLRKYPLGEAGAHVVGYIGQISKEDLGSPLYQGYASGDLVGKSGLEASYEQMLKGTDGKILQEVNAQGKIVRTLGETDPIPGQNVTVSLDSNFQQKVFDAMRGVAKGAVIVSSPKGEILALVSKPSFDTNLFTLGEHYHPSPDAEYKTVEQVLLDNEGQPILNRAIGGVYPPGSTFKLVVAAAGLETGTIDEKYTVDDTGILKVGDFSFANWYFTSYGRTEGQVDVVKAIKRSNDIFFYKVGNLLGVDRLSAFAQKFGLGQKTGIDLFGEDEGLLPTKSWKEKVIGDKWYLGDDYHYGIGQGYLLTTPLQVNIWTQAIANAGVIYSPHLFKDQTPKVLSRNILNQKNTDLIRQGMTQACSDGGVAWPLFNFKVSPPAGGEKLKVNGKDILEVSQSATTSANMKQIVIACKTGTAEHGNSSQEPHAWITLFAPAYNPQIIVTVLSEASGEGSNIAGPIAKQVLTDWFER